MSDTLLLKNIPLTLFERVVFERQLETKQTISVVPFSFSRVAQPEARGPLLPGAGFLYHILSPTGLVSKLLNQGSRGPLLSGAGFLYHIFSPTHCLPVFTELYNSSIAHSISPHNWPSECVTSAVFGMACLIFIKLKKLSCSSQVSLFRCISL